MALHLPARKTMKTVPDSVVKNSIYVRVVSSRRVRAILPLYYTWSDNTHLSAVASLCRFLNQTPLLARGGEEQSSLRSNIHGVWMCSLSSDK